MSAAGTTSLSLPPGPDFFGRLAALLLDRHGAALSGTDLVLPSIALATPLRNALSSTAGRALFMPRMLTPQLLAARWLGEAPVESHARRLLGLVAQLRRMHWLGDADLWAVARELIDLADALADIDPPDEASLEGLFARTHALHDSEALSLEARLVHAVWLADCTGAPGHARAAVQALQRAAAQATRPLTFVSDRSVPPPAWLETWAQRAPVLFVSARREDGASASARALAGAWPVDPADRRAVGSRPVSLCDAQALLDRTRLVSSQSLEQAARHAADCICGWLAAGRRNIALVAADREAARRTRALLERRQVLLADETGWKLSTTRAAATVDALLQCLASDGYHRDLLDLVRSPYVAGSMDADRHAQAVAELDAWVVRRNHVDGLQALLADAAHDLAARPAAALLHSLALAVGRMPTGSAPASFWIERLLSALDALQAREALAQDTAGAQVIALLEQLRVDSSGVSLNLNFADWRQWLNGEFEQALFRDSAIDSPVVLTHLPATRLRSFEAVYVIGADSEHLAPPRVRGVLGHDGLRRELGLPDASQMADQLREDLAGLIECSEEVVFGWQALRNGEALLPADDLQRLDLMVRQTGLPSAMQAAPALVDPLPLPLPPLASAPVLDPTRVPDRLTASAMADLMACPYRYFARRVLGLSEGDEVEETLDKGGVGERIHRVLLDFHTAHPVLARHAAGDLEHALCEIIARVFADAIARNFQEHAWSDRLQQRAPAYVAWALQREAAGWLFAGGEQPCRRMLDLSDGSALALEGRIDRIDRAADGIALLDYKLRSAKNVKDSVEGGEDVQLAFYALLMESPVIDAAYLALDEAEPVAFAQPDPLAAASALHGLIGTVFPALRAGAALPAHGDERACSHCDIRGLCRRDWRADR